jgi:hypothetical protein
MLLVLILTRNNLFLKQKSNVIGPLSLERVLFLQRLFEEHHLRMMSSLRLSMRVSATPISILLAVNGRKPGEHLTSL